MELDRQIGAGKAGDRKGKWARFEFLRTRYGPARRSTGIVGHTKELGS